MEKPINSLKSNIFTCKPDEMVSKRIHHVTGLFGQANGLDVVVEVDAVLEGNHGEVVIGLGRGVERVLEDAALVDLEHLHAVVVLDGCQVAVAESDVSGPEVIMDLNWRLAKKYV